MSIFDTCLTQKNSCAFLRVLARFFGFLARFLGLLARSCAAIFGDILRFSESCARKSKNVTISPPLVI